MSNRRDHEADKGIPVIYTKACAKVLVLKTAAQASNSNFQLFSQKIIFLQKKSNLFLESLRRKNNWICSQVLQTHRKNSDDLSQALEVIALQHFVTESQKLGSDCEPEGPHSAPVNKS